jgi:hypothetical protein
VEGAPGVILKFKFPAQLCHFRMPTDDFSDLPVNREQLVLSLSSLTLERDIVYLAQAAVLTRRMVIMKSFRIALLLAILETCWRPVWGDVGWVSSGDAAHLMTKNQSIMMQNEMVTIQ